MNKYLLALLKFITPKPHIFANRKYPVPMYSKFHIVVFSDGKYGLQRTIVGKGLSGISEADTLEELLVLADEWLDNNPVVSHYVFNPPN